MGSSAFILLAFVCSLAVAEDSHTVMPTVMPTATPAPPNPEPIYKNATFVLYDENSTNVCLRMVVTISVNLTYINTTKQNASTLVPLTNKAMIADDRSTCSSTAKKATLYVSIDDDDDEAEMDPSLYMVFGFSGGKDSWSLGSVNLTVDTAVHLTNYDQADTILTFETSHRLNDSANEEIEFTRSYKCNNNQTLYYNNNSAVVPIVQVGTLRVQAFQFRNKTSGDFDNARSCLLDTRGKANKIVPIAVGAALAGLVVVVLIAYLIGRLRSRRQSSYEALS